MTRKYVVTGAASGIGKALTEQLRAEGHTVFGVDLRDADVTVDLTTAEGRIGLVDQVTELSGGTVDAVIAVAGLSAPIPATVGVNYFGAIATLDGLRPMAGVVRWARDGQYGISFLQVIPIGELCDWIRRES